jgi:hypothetical protein
MKSEQDELFCSLEIFPTLLDCDLDAPAVRSNTGGDSILSAFWWEKYRGAAGGSVCLPYNLLGSKHTDE